MNRDLKNGLTIGGGFMVFLNFLGRLADDSPWGIIPAGAAVAFMAAVLCWPVKR